MRLGIRPVGTAALVLCVPLLLGGLLAGCGGLLPKAPERPLYRLTPAVGLQQPARRVGALLVIATPTASAGLDTKRIALIRSPVAIDYFAEGEWVDRPPFLVKEALLEGFQKSGAFAGVSSEGLGLNADYVLNTDIRDFTAIYDSPDGPPLVRVRLAAELITMPGRNIAAATSVAREARAGSADLPAIVRAFDSALGETVRDVIAWAANNRALSARGR
ncbi:MAG: ABC-type transport auxiliary lipoprotein family protein [Alphaproteobacteria bacterium]